MLFWFKFVIEHYDIESLLPWFRVISSIWSNGWLCVSIDTYMCVFNMKQITYLDILADFYSISEFEMINFASVNIDIFFKKLCL